MADPMDRYPNLAPLKREPQSDIEILETMRNERGKKLFEEAQEKYPYLKDKNIYYTYSPYKGRGMLEFFPPQEPGSPEFPRPQEFPLSGVGIEVYDPKTRPIDILADYVSHYGVENDPYLIERYRQFANSLNQNQKNRLQSQYRHYQNHPQYNEQRPFEEWERVSGIPGYFRGYTFNQWENPEELYTQQQIQLLDEVRKYLGIK